MFYLWWLVVLLITILTGGSPCYAATALTKMVVAYASISPRVAPLWAAQEQGFFRKNGIEAELIFVRGAPTLVAALASATCKSAIPAVLRC
jgi:ABC-type nitrate/sulfonate/bicarbonate transport system substrate-binding protein